MIGFFAGDPWLGRGEGRFAPQMSHQCHHIRHAVNGHALGQSGLGGVFGGDIEGFDPRAHGGHGHGQNAAHRAQRTRQRQLAEKGRIVGRLFQRLHGGHNAEENGQVINGAFLFLVGGGEVYGDAADGKFFPAVFDGCPHALAGFPHGGIGQADHIEGRKPS